MNFYGIHITDRMIHVSPLCPMIKKTRTRDAGTISLYTTESDAVIDGHNTRCSVCFNMLMFNLKIGDESRHFLLKKDEADFVLELTNRLSLDYCSISGMSNSLKMPEPVVEETMRKMHRSGLVSIARPGWQAKGRKLRRASEWGRALAIAYATGLYGIQSEIMQKQTERAGEYDRIS